MTTFSDPRIIEASGMAALLTVADRAVAVNDDDPGGSGPVAFIVQLSTGQTLGTCRVDGYTLVDIESCDVDKQGRMWVADVGDNSASRSDCALYARAEFGNGNKGPIPWARFPVSYADGPHNCEAFAIQPATNDRYLITKANPSRVYKLPPLKRDVDNVATKVTINGLDVTLGNQVTDADFTIDGRFLLVIRKDENTTAFVYEPTGHAWHQVGTIPVPPGLSKIEAITVQRGGNAFTVTEDKGSAGAQLITVPIPVKFQPIVAPVAQPTPPAAPVASPFPSSTC